MCAKFRTSGPITSFVFLISYSLIAKLAGSMTTVTRSTSLDQNLANSSNSSPSPNHQGRGTIAVDHQKAPPVIQISPLLRVLELVSSGQEGGRNEYSFSRARLRDARYHKTAAGGEDECAKDEFHCLHLNLNQILTIHDWNRQPKTCIPQSYRCDGRHDCQDGSDEVECFVHLPRKNSFKCFVGEDDDLTVEDCRARDKDKRVSDPREKSRSVSEMKEWVCSKIIKPKGQGVVRDCMRLYTGGEALRVCYANQAEGITCLCSKDLCNGAKPAAISAKPTQIVLLTIVIFALDKLFM